MELPISPDRISTKKEDLEVYGQDWSQLIPPNPSAVVFPQSTEEVAQVLRYCNEQQIAVVPSGGRTGLSGGACAAKGEVVLSLERMNKIGPVNPLSFTVQVECGAITQAVHEACAPHGLTWPVDFASKGSSMVGGNLATNAGGVRVIRYGNARNWVLGITAVTMDGTIHHFNGALEKNNTGYDFRQLLIGSEGTLAVMTEAVLKLAPLPEETSVYFFALEGFSQVVQLFQEARKAPFALSAFEVLDSLCYQSVTKNLHISPPISTPAGAYVLMEFEHSKESNGLEEWLGSLFEKDMLLDGVMAKSQKEKDDLWKIREGVAESIMMDGIVYQQDVSVPVDCLENFYTGISERYAKAYPDFSTFFFGHIGDGNLHIFIRKPKEMETKQFEQRCYESNADLFSFVHQFRGSVSAEHGIGLLKKNAIQYSRSKEELALMAGIKKVFDPRGLLNPGKLLRLCEEEC